MDRKMLTLTAQVEIHPRSCRRDQERSSLWELVNTFVHRGMERVFCELVDETGSMRSGMYHIDARLSWATGKTCHPVRSRRAPLRDPCVARCLVPGAVASLSREKAGCEEWTALSEELADLQASPDEEIRRLTELFRTDCRPPALKRQPNLQKRLSVSNVRTSQTRHWKRTRNSSCVPRSSLWRLILRIAVGRSPILKRLDALSERTGCERTRRPDRSRVGPRAESDRRTLGEDDEHKQKC